MATSNDTDRELIISEIKRLENELGRTPGMEIFAKNTGIGKHRWYGKIWSKWSDALLEAGLEANQLQQKYDSSKLLHLLAAQVREFGKIPTQAELNILRTRGADLPHPEIFSRHFGGERGVRNALVEHCKTNAEYSDLLQYLPDSTTPSVEPKRNDGHVYLLKSGDHYKIGRTSTLERRIKEISVALPEAVSLEHAIATDDPIGIEAYWHRRFADQRANGEWFKLSREDVRAFKKRRFQ